MSHLVSTLLATKVSMILLRSALIILSLFILIHLCGGQSHVSALAGVHVGSSGEALIGFLYVCIYLLAISLVPILLIAAVIMFAAKLSGAYQQ